MELTAEIVDEYRNTGGFDIMVRVVPNIEEKSPNSIKDWKTAKH
jgi:hypothetical protein